MKFRVARKLIFGRAMSKRIDRMPKYAPYYNERGCWTMPSRNPIPRMKKALKVYTRHVKREKRRRFL